MDGVVDMEHGFILRKGMGDHRVYMVSEAVCRATAGEAPSDKTVEKFREIGFVPREEGGHHLAAFLNRHHIFDGDLFHVKTKRAEDEDPDDVRLPLAVVSVIKLRTEDRFYARFNKHGYPLELSHKILEPDDVNSEDGTVTFPPKSQVRTLPAFMKNAIKDGEVDITVDYNVEEREVYVITTVVVDTLVVGPEELYAEDSPVIFFQ